MTDRLLTKNTLHCITLTKNRSAMLHFKKSIRPTAATALRAAMHRPCLVDLPGFPLFSYIYENQSRGPHRNQRSVSYGESGGRRRLYGAQRHPMRPPCRTRFCPTSPRFYRTLIDGTPYFLRPLRPNRIRTTALRAAIYLPYLVDLPTISPFLVYLREPIPGPP